MRISMLEIYNETIRDLLSKSISYLDIRTHGKNVSLDRLTEVGVETMEEVTKLTLQGEKNRVVGATKMNSHSSSHI
ncbi:PREDICTED: kinesin-like protein klp-3 [Priapulus caudatus]|uniref:Kinesin-like protein klp-3 n=1 Tax=Priapulus caudatus TaxID=37621 RepID=A0ABM1F1Z8_PRICU|nr:PREDICTED: kinesin-like protein klp-3 [Priapulus caudatus]